MNEALKVENLNKYFREPEEFHVLQDISFSVNKGEFVRDHWQVRQWQIDFAVPAEHARHRLRRRDHH